LKAKADFLLMSPIKLEKKLNILMLAPTMFFADYGGHIRILEEALELRRRGHKVTILTYPNGRDIADLDVRRCLGVPFNYRVEVGSSRHKYYLDVMLGLRGLIHVLRHKPDVIHAHMHEGALIGSVLSKLTGAPLLFDFQGSLTGEMLDHNFIKPDSVQLKFFRWLENRINRSAEVILTSSHHASQLLQAGFKVPPGRIHPTPDCVDSHTFQRSNFSAPELNALRQRWNLPADKKILVYAGLLTKYQGIDLTLQALQLLKAHRNDFHLLLMGFPSVKVYREMARFLGVDHLITFTDKMPYDQLPAHLALGDIALAPKLSSTEGLGKILNYMSMGLPTITFATPVSQEYLGQYGLYATERTPAGLAESIATALDMPPLARQELGHTLRRIAIAYYSWEKIGQQLETVYAAILAGHPHPAFTVEPSPARSVSAS
jgi:glycosyltransferase involved in cell wall biosynthesis